MLVIKRDGGETEGEMEGKSRKIKYTEGEREEERKR